MGWGEKPVADSKGAATPAYADASAAPTLLITGKEEVMPPTKTDDYSDGTMPDAELRARTMSSAEAVDAHEGQPQRASNLSTMTVGDLERRVASETESRRTTPPTRPATLDAPLAQEFLEGDRVSIKIANPEPTNSSTTGAITGYNWEGPGTEHLNTIVTIVPGTAPGDYSFAMARGHTEAEITDQEILAVMDWRLFWGNHENFKQLPEGQQIVIGRYFLFHSSGEYEGQTRDRLEIINMLNGATGENGLPAHLSDPLTYVDEVLPEATTDKKSREARQKALKAFQEQTEETGNPKDAAAWRMALRAESASSPQEFLDALHGDKDRNTGRQDFENIMTAEEEPLWRDGEGSVDQADAVMGEMLETYDTGTGQLNEDERIGDALINGSVWKERQERTAAALTAIRETTHSPENFKAYCQARFVAEDGKPAMKDADITAAYADENSDAKKAWLAARDQQSMTEALDAAAVASGKADAAVRFLEGDVARARSVLEQERAAVAAMRRTDPKKQAAEAQLLAHEEAFKKMLGTTFEGEAESYVLDESARTTLISGDQTAYETQRRRLKGEAQAKAETLTPLSEQYEILDETGRFESLQNADQILTQKVRQAESRQARAQERIAAGEMTAEQYQALYLQDEIDDRRREIQKELKRKDLTDGQRHTYKQKLQGLNADYHRLNPVGHHKQRLESLEEQRQAIVDFWPATLEAAERGDKEALDRLLYPRDKKGEPVFTDLTEYESTRTPAGETKFEEEHSKHRKTMKTVDNVIEPFTKAGEALSTVSQGVTAVDGIAKIIEGPENTVGQAQVTAASKRREKKAAIMEKMLAREVAKNMREFIKGLREREQTAIQKALADATTGEEATRAGRIKNRYVSVMNGAAFADEYTPEDKGALTESQVAKTDAEAAKIEAQAQIQAGRASAVMV